LRLQRERERERERESERERERERARVRKGSRSIKEKPFGGKRKELYIWGERASCYKVPRKCPLVLQIRILIPQLV
jgi:hypothetical protein